MTLIGRILSEKRVAVTAVAVAVVVAIGLYVLAVYPLAVRVGAARVRESAARDSLVTAQQSFQAAREAMDSQSLTSEQLDRFYREVLPPDLAGARHITYARLAALASDGNKLWSRLHAPKTDARVAALLGAEGGGGLVVGSERQADQTWRPRVRRFDAMGNLTWQRTWPWEPDSQLLAGDRLANGDLLLAGHRPLAAGGAVALLRTDAWGHAQCAETGVCAGLTEAACDDATKCTADICEPGNGCQHGLLADGSPCAIGLSCAVSQCVP